MSHSRFSIKLKLPFFALASSAKQERKRRASSSEAERENVSTTTVTAAAVAAASEALEGRCAQKTDDSDDRSVCPVCKNPFSASSSSVSNKKKQSGVCKCRRPFARSFFRRDPRRHSHAGTSEADSLRNKLNKTLTTSNLEYFEDEADLFEGIARCSDETVGEANAVGSSTSSSHGRQPEVPSVKKVNPPRRPASCTFGKLEAIDDGDDDDMASFVKANFLDPKQGKLNKNKQNEI